MKRSGLFALVIALPLAASAQYADFTDNFNNGSTLNQASTPGGTPSASFTSYDIAATKAATTAPAIGSGRFRIGLNGSTTAGNVEAQAVFSLSPVSLNTVGDYITLTYTFTNTGGTVLGGGTSSFLYQGLYNSGGQPPVPGGLNNSGLTGSSFPNGYCQNWVGYVGRIANNGTSRIATRDPQTDSTSRNQALLNDGSSSGAYNKPAGTTIGTQTVPVTLTADAPYTVVYTITLTDVGTLTIANNLFDGVGTGGTLLFSQTNVASSATYLTNSFDALAIGLRNSGTSMNPTMDISSISVASSIYGTPGPSFGVTGGGTGCPGDSFALGLTGSVSTNDYRIFTNGVFNGVVQSGTGAALSFPPETVISAALTNTVQASNTVSGFTGLMSGEAVVAPFAAPVITNEPVALIVATNSVGTFTVGSSGSGLGYQWYRNGTKLMDGGNLSGTTSSILVISPATTADAATAAQGYYVVITNGCGISSTSTTNSLTLGPPANIVWQGGNPDNTWDVAATANFTNGSGPVVFHNGDNVTFDDTSVNPMVSIVGNYVAPGLITVSANQPYAFTGSGKITGPGALLVSGFGTLSVSNANTYSGGTTISNGTIVIRNGNFNSLGTGPINLAGGNLELPTAGGSNTGLSNDVVALSTGNLQWDLTGTYACVLFGGLSGNANATLTLYNYNGNTATSRLRLYAPFTNDANVVISSLGSEIEVAPYLSSGNQVFNGVISGNYGHFVPRGNGSVVFNNTNTFNDTLTSEPSGYSLLLSSGNAGIGADSVSANPPVIDASPVGTGAIGINTGTEGGTCSLFASGGSHSIANKIAYTSATNTVTLVLGGSNNLTLAGEFDLANPGDAAGTNRTIQVTNTAITTISGLVTDNGLSSSLIKTGNGVLALTASETYSGATTIGGGNLWVNGQIAGSGVTVTNGGALGGTGTVSSAVTIEEGGALAPGTSSIGTLTINSSLAIGGNLIFKVNKSLTPSNDTAVVSGTLNNTGTGTVIVSNLGPAIAIGDKFTLFNKSVANGGALSVTGAGMTWSNNLANDGSIIAVGTVTTVSTNITFSVSGGNLTLSWPADHRGWYLQMQTNGLGSSNAWVDVAGSSGTTNAVIPIDPNIPNAFFRMSLQP